jgi:hypothetical protein
MRYQMVLRILDDEGNECGAVAGEQTASPASAAKDVLHRYDGLEDEAGRVKKPVDLSDDLKWAARRFGV